MNDAHASKSDATNVEIRTVTPPMYHTLPRPRLFKRIYLSWIRHRLSRLMPRRPPSATRAAPAHGGDDDASIAPSRGAAVIATTATATATAVRRGNATPVGQLASSVHGGGASSKDGKTSGGVEGDLGDRHEAVMDVRCELCGVTQTSRWRRIHVDGRTNLLARASDRSDAADDERAGMMKRMMCCKGCFQKKLRERTLLDRDKVCVECKSDASTDWHKKDKSTAGPPDLCNACYERFRREDITKGGECSRCEKVTTRPLLKLPGASNSIDKCCSLCYHKERYRLRRDMTSCARCATTKSTIWRKSSTGPSDARLCITCWRKEQGEGGSGAANGREAREPRPPPRVPGEPDCTGCAFCDSKKSCAWRKAEGKTCCSACYQRISRQLRKSRCTNCDKTPDKSMQGWVLNTGYKGVCPECRAAGVAVGVL